MQILTIPFVLIALIAVAALPGAWLVMLALGNFGFSQFGLIDCLPAGFILGALVSGNGN